MNLIQIILMVGAALLSLSVSQKGFRANLSSRLMPNELALKTKSRLIFRGKTNPLLELPDFACILWFLMSSGLSLEQSLRYTTDKCSGAISAEFSEVLKKVDHGALLHQELEQLASDAKLPQVRELATKLALSMSNGSAMAEQLADFTEAVTVNLKTMLLDKAHKSETKMMIPLVFVILPVTVVFAIYPSVVMISQSLQ